MIILPAEPAQGFVKLPYHTFIADHVTKSGGVVETLGPSSDPSMDLYGVKIETQPNRPWFFVQSAIHGQHEWTSAYWCVKFMRHIINPSQSPSPHIYRWLRNQWNWYFIPVVNPWGYENGPSEQGSTDKSETRYNANSVDLNRNFDADWEEYESTRKGSSPFSEPETQAVRDAVLSVKPLVFLDWHTWGGEIEQGKFSNHPPELQHMFALLNDAKDTWIAATGEQWGPAGVRSEWPSAKHWVIKQANSTGRPTVAATAEISYKYSLDVQMRLGVTANLALAVHLAHWYNTGEQMLYEEPW